ncbi:MAG: penicillin-binding protein 2 [Deltaproteobacteria bacterium]|nr:penicillin-binding protein 2 [Deltaproteobacteria bacterium]
MKKKKKIYISIKIIIVGVMFGLMFTAIVAKAVWLQAYKHAELSKRAAKEYQSYITVIGKRGTIYDKNGIELAATTDEISISANPYKIKNKKETAAKIGKILNISPKTLLKKLNSKNKFVWIKRQSSPRHAKNIKQTNIAGINFLPEHTRFYPNKTLAGQIIGLSGLNGKGLEGIELYYHDYLKGEKKKITGKKDGKRKWFAFNEEGNFQTKTAGNDIILTIDKTVQFITARALKEAADKHKAKSGIAVVADSKTGAILAIANYPFFNPNIYNKFPKKVWRNRAVTDSFEPGSIMKMFLVSAAIESGLCTEHTVFFCENGRYRIGKNVIHDIHKYEDLTVADIIKFSSNIGASKISETIGEETLYNSLLNFGFGEKTGIDYPGETPGVLYPFRRWAKIDAATIAFGQGISVTAVQLVAAASAIANGGTLMKPYIVDSIIGKNGEIIKKIHPEQIRRAVSEETAEIVRNLLNRATQEGGTGVRASSNIYEVCGKTGTAQKVSEAGYEKGKYVSSFLGFAPAEDPKLTILISLDEPTNKYYGGIVASPAFGRIVREALDYLNVPSKKKIQKITASINKEPIG